MKYRLMIGLSLLLVGCAGAMVVKVPLKTLPSQDLAVSVKVNDLRAPGVAASTRESTLGVPMGNIVFNPSEAQLVKNMLEVELAKKGEWSATEYVCDIIEFGVNTNKNPVLYWDVTAHIHVVLKYNGKESDLHGTSTNRTYVWPGEAIIKTTVDQALGQIASQLK